MKKLIYISGLAFLFSFSAQAQNFTISGYIEDGDSGEKLIGANLFDFTSNSGTVSNNFGFYSITLPQSTIDLQVSYIGFQSTEMQFELSRDTTINLSLSSSVQMKEVVIKADRNSEGRIEESSSMSTVDVPIEQIKKIPALLGETDVIKALQLLPGVQSGGEGQSGLYVRGGSPDQNLILLDGVPVYNVNHLFGFFSVFNADAIKDVKLIKGGFPARYGGRLSSVLEINMKEGSTKGFHGEGAIGLISSKLTLEGPLSEKTSCIVSGRRTYIDLLAKPFIKSGFEDDGQQGDTGYYFYDLNAKINHSFSDKDKLYLSAYTGKDLFYFESLELDSEPADKLESKLGWGNLTTALRWNHLVSQKLFLNTTLTYSRYGFDVGNTFGEVYEDDARTSEYALDYKSGINDYALKFDFDYLPTPNHYIKFGIMGIRHDFRPGDFNLRFDDPEDFLDIDTIIGQKRIDANEFAAYIEDDFTLGNLKINAGIHTSLFDVNDKTYASIQPRISSRYLFPGGYAFKASFATMNQYIHLLSNEGIGLPTDLWVPSTAKIAPQTSWQGAVGIAKTLNDSYELSIEGYYKKMDNLIAYKDGSGLFEFTDWQDRITTGRGTSYGLEFFIQKKKGRLNGWLGYTWSNSTRQFDEINFGKEFPYRYDRRNDVSLVLNYEVSDKINIAGTWVYGTGNAITLANSNYRAFYDVGVDISRDYYSYYEDRNNFRMRAYHRMDLGLTYTRDKGNWKSVWAIGAYNAYNQKNPFFIFTDGDFDDNTGQYSTKLKQASLFPIIPYVTYSFKF